MLNLLGGRRCLVDLLGAGEVELPLVYRKFIGDKEWADSIICDNYNRLSDEISSEKKTKIGISDPSSVIKVVAQVFGVSVNRLFEDKVAKKWCLYILYKETPLDARYIGKIFGMQKWAVHKAAQRLEHKKKSRSEIKMLNMIRHKMSNVQT